MKTMPYAGPATIGLLLAGCIHVNLVAPPPTPAPLSTLADWGTPVNPDEDCRFFLSDGTLLIHVPGSPRPHDLSAELGNVNAPRVLQEAKGDFTLQVRVEGRFVPGSRSMLARRTPYNGAGLVAVFDDGNVVTLARAVLRHGDGGPMPYANFEIRVNRTIARLGEETETPIPLDGPIHLRLERRGMRMLGAWSTDGLTWTILESKELPASWPSVLHVGVIAINNTQDEFNPRFSALQLLD
jgi:regulation of enolase protein 1 (concanavalin A-like superfamily)